MLALFTLCSTPVAFNKHYISKQYVFLLKGFVKLKLSILNIYINIRIVWYCSTTTFTLITIISYTYSIWLFGMTQKSSCPLPYFWCFEKYLLKIYLLCPGVQSSCVILMDFPLFYDKWSLYHDFKLISFICKRVCKKKFNIFYNQNKSLLIKN